MKTRIIRKYIIVDYARYASLLVEKTDVGSGSCPKVKVVKKLSA